MLFPHVHCTADLQICQVTTGESEINAAATITAVALSNKFDLTSTYFMIAGIAGVSPLWSTLGGVALSRYAVQVALQCEYNSSATVFRYLCALERSRKYHFRIRRRWLTCA